MENNKSYLRHFGLLFLLFFAVSVLVVWQFTRQTPESYEQFSLFTIIVEFLPVILMLSAVGFATGQRGAAMGSILFAVGVKVILFLIRSDFSQGSGQGLRFWLNQLAFLSPYMLFLLLSKPATKRIPLLLAGTLLVYGDNNMFSAIQGFEKINELFELGWKIPAYIPYFFSYLLSFVIHFLLLCELVNYGRGKTEGYRPRLLNPGNEYSKLTGTLLFWSLKLFIILSVTGCLFTLESFARYTAAGEEYSYLRNMDYLQWYYLLSILATIPAMFCTAWYLRKFLMEYFMTWQHSSRLLYWFLLIPVLGFFAWLVMLADSDRNHSFTERKKTLGDFAASSKDGIIAVFLVFLALRLLLTLSNGTAGSVITVFLSAALFFAMISSRGGYYFNLYLNIVIMSVLLLILFFGKGAGGEYVLLLYPVILFNVLQVILIFPALHIGAFDYISYEEEKPWQPGDDLF